MPEEWIRRAALLTGSVGLFVSPCCLPHARAENETIAQTSRQIRVLLSGNHIASGAGNDAMPGLQEFAELFYDAPSCNFVTPDLDCLRKIMVPLTETREAPFDKDMVSEAFTPFGPYVAKDWQLTTLHRLPHRILGSLQQCGLSDFRYSATPFDLSGCGQFLFIGGHSKIKNCANQNVPFTCLDQIPLAERPDIALIKAHARERFLPVAGTDDLKVSDIVFVIHQPLFDWLDFSQSEELRKKGPFLTRGTLLEVNGNTAAVIAPSYQGTSGGTVLNGQGKVVGIVAARLEGIPVFYFQVLNPRMLETIGLAAKN